MPKNPPQFLQPEDLDSLLSNPPRTGMFGAPPGQRQNADFPDFTPPSAIPFPFSPPASGLDPNAIANLVTAPSVAPPLSVDAWGRAAGNGTLPAGPDMQFSAASPAARAPRYHQPPPEVVAAAQASQRATGIPASATIAQWMHEGGWGRKIPPNSNNYWGIKEPDPTKPRVKVETKEYKDGKPYWTPQYFRKFNSPEEGWAAHTRLLTNDPRYAKAMRLTGNPDAFVDAIAGTYAPGNPFYAQRIKDTMRKNHLYQYNVLPPDSR